MKINQVKLLKATKINSVVKRESKVHLNF